MPLVVLVRHHGRRRGTFSMGFQEGCHRFLGQKGLDSLHRDLPVLGENVHKRDDG